MTKDEVVKRLKSLLYDSREFVSLEPTKEDIQALEIAIRELESAVG